MASSVSLARSGQSIGRIKCYCSDMRAMRSTKRMHCRKSRSNCFFDQEGVLHFSREMLFKRVCLYYGPHNICTLMSHRTCCLHTWSISSETWVGPQKTRPLAPLSTGRGCRDLTCYAAFSRVPLVQYTCWARPVHQASTQLENADFSGDLRPVGLHTGLLVPARSRKLRTGYSRFTHPVGSPVRSAGR